MTEKVKNTIQVTFIVVFALIIIVLPSYNIFIEGKMFDKMLWPKVYEGFFELVTLALIIFIGLSLKKRWLKNIFKPIALVLVLISLRRHNVDIPVLIAFFYINSFFFLGSFFNISVKAKAIQLVYNVVFGMIAFALFSLLLSVFNLAIDYVLFAFSMLVSILSFFFKGRSIPSVVDFQKLKAGIKQFPLFTALFSMVVFMLVFQTNNVPGFDEFWYSIRPGELLNRHGSFFEKIIYPNNWVAYYPKLTDVLIYPLLLIPNYAVAKMFSVACWGMVAVLVFSFLRQAIDQKKALMYTLIIVTIPALGVMAVFTKGEVLALLIFLVGFGFMKSALKHRDLNNFILALLLALVATTARLSALMFTFIFIIYFLLVFFWKYRSKGIYFIRSISLNSLILIATLLFFLLYYRTYRIVGVPLVQLDDRVPFIYKVYNFIGCDYNFCLKPLLIEEYEKVSSWKILINSIFKPLEVRAGRVWYSNFYFFVLITFIIYSFLEKKKVNRVDSFFALILIVVFWFSSGVVMGNDFYNGGDGNYFLIPVILSSVLFLKEITFKRWGMKIVTALFIVYFPFHFSLALLRGPNLDPGTGTIHFDLKQNPLVGNSNPSNYYNQAVKKLKINDIAQFLPDDGDTYLAGNVSGAPNLYKLGCSSLNIINVEKGRSYLFETYNTYKIFLRETGINFLIQPNEFESKFNFSKYFWIIKDEPGVLVHKGKNYTLLDLREAKFLKEKP
ncbi:MAG: hypothetical protein JW798_12460 [Prolixibacteraceae bacterium]|nr:hypothetical protein [Prolixibacteraceae bacterium]